MNLVVNMPPQPRKKKAPPGEWMAGLEPSGQGYLGDERNVLIALRNAPDLKGLFKLNSFSLQVELSRPPPWRTDLGVWTENDDTELAAFLQAWNIKVRGTGAVSSCVAVVAAGQAFHPVRDYLNALKWDGHARLNSWAVEYLKASGNADYLAAVGTKFLVSAVARVMGPGCQADHVVVLEGPQGAGKTSTARAIAVKPEWFAGSLPDISTKDAALQLCGRWIVEIAELKAIRTSQIESVKTYLSQCTDTFRPPYGRRTGQFPRQCVFIGTTNESEYLLDRTGNRRYWPIRCGKVDLDALIRDRDQLWAEAFYLYQQGHIWHLDAAEAALAADQQTERVYVTELEHDIRDFLARYTDDEVSVRDVLIYACNIEPDKTTYTEAAKRLGPSVAQAMELAGWSKIARVGKSRRTMYRRRPE